MCFLNFETYISLSKLLCYRLVHQTQKHVSLGLYIAFLLYTALLPSNHVFSYELRHLTRAQPSLQRKKLSLHLQIYAYFRINIERHNSESIIRHDLHDWADFIIMN